MWNISRGRETAPLKVTVDHAPPNAILALLASIFITLGGLQGHLNSYQANDFTGDFTPLCNGMT